MNQATSLPPYERLQREAERDEMRFCSCLMKDKDQIKDAVTNGITVDWFWSEPCQEMYSVLSRYFQEHKTLCPYETYQSILSKVATGPDSVNDKMVFVQKVFQMHTSKDDYPYLRKALVERYAQKRVWPVLDKAYTDLSVATHGQEAIVEKFCQDIAEARRCIGTNRNPIRSIGDFALGPDNGGNLLGRRFLCRGGAMLLWGATGIGKSSLVIQMAHCFALGRDWFGLVPSKPLKILYISAENDDGDMAEIRDGVRRGLQLSDDDIAAVEKMFRVVCIDDKCGAEFIATLDGLLADDRPDLVIVDPLLSYLGGDPSSAEYVTPFLRNGINPLLHRYGCAMLAVHHIPKPSRQGIPRGRQSRSDASYSYLGSSDLINWARAAISLSPLAQGDVCEVRYVKRSRRNGIGIGTHTESVHIQWNKEDGICWLPAPTAAPADAVDVTEAEPKDLLKYMPDDETVSKKWLTAAAIEHLAVGRNKADGWVELLEGSALVERQEMASGGGRKPVGYRKTAKGRRAVPFCASANGQNDGQNQSEEITDDWLK